MIGGWNRRLHRTCPVKLEIGKSIHDKTAVKEVGKLLLYRAVPFEMLHIRLVGDVKNTALIESRGFHLRKKGAQESTQKADIFLGEGIRLPAEKLSCLAAYRSDNLRRVLRTPLCEKVRNFKIPYPAPLAKRGAQRCSRPEARNASRPHPASRRQAAPSDARRPPPCRAAA